MPPPAKEPVAEKPPIIAAINNIGIALEKNSRKHAMGSRAVAKINVFFLPQMSVIIPKNKPKKAVASVANAKILPKNKALKCRSFNIRYGKAIASIPAAMLLVILDKRRIQRENCVLSVKFTAILIIYKNR